MPDTLYRFANPDLFRALCGVADSRIEELEKLLGVKLIPRGHAFFIQTDSTGDRERTIQFFDAVTRRFGESGLLPESFDTEYLFKTMKGEEGGFPELRQEKIFTTVRGRPITARTARQSEYVASIMENAITIGIGPAGTGKTFLAIVAACRLLTQGIVDRIILTRPAVEAGESLGFLPGDLTQKVDPYLRPLYDALYECLGMEKVHQETSARRIEIAPLAYMRGRTLNDSIIILDEAQNCTLSQLKMFLTRLGRNSRMCLGGDVTQVDLSPGRSGFLEAARILRDIEGIGIVEFGKEDIIRNAMVERVVRAFEMHGEARDSDRPRKT